MIRIMSRTCFALLFLTCLSANLPALAATGCLAPPAGLVGWWPGDTNENDIAGSNNPSSVTGVTNAPGEVLNGFTFGTKGYIQIPSSPSLANQQFTWAAWVRPDGAGPNEDAYGSVIVEQASSGTYTSVLLSWRSTDSRFVFTFGNVTSTGAGSATITSADTYLRGSFYFVAGTYDGSVFRLFVNGNLEATFSEAETIAYSSLGWTIGSNPPTAFPAFTRTWNGVIDEVQAFSRALSPAELLAIYGAAGAGECKSAPAPPTITTGGVVPVCSATPTIQAGSWASIYGNNLAPSTAVWNGDFPKTLGGVSVTINSKPAYLWYVSPTQINVQPPDDGATGPVMVTVTNASGTVSSTVTLAQYAPCFSLQSAKYPAAIVQTPGPGNSGGGYDIIGPTGAFPYATRPVKPGEILILFGVGFGPTTPPVLAGEVYSGAAQTITPPQITIGGVPAVVDFAGIVEAGLYQFNVVVPSAGSGDQPLQAMIGGVVTPANIFVTLQ